MKTDLAKTNEKSSHDTTSGGANKTYPYMLAGFQFLLYAVACVLLVESVFYFARVGESDHLMPDLKLGFKPFANKRITQRSEGFGSFNFNSFGMQNNEIAQSKPAGTMRIGVFGDSYVESLQVPRELNYCSLLAKNLSQKLGKPVEVLNFGVSNYSIAQDYLRYQNLGKSFQPDLVIVAYRVGETEKVLPDNRPSLAFVRPMLFPQEDSTLKYDNTTVSNFYRSKEGKRLTNTHFLREHSRIWSTLGRLQQSWSGLGSLQQCWSGPGNPLKEEKAAPPLIADESTREKFVNCYWYMIDAIFKNFSKECTENHTAMLIMRTPMVHPGEYILSRNKVEAELLKTTATAANASFINIDERLQEYVSSKNYKPYFLDGSHFSKTMHKFVADQLGDKIATDLADDLANDSVSDSSKTSPASDNILK